MAVARLLSAPVRASRVGRMLRSHTSAPTSPVAPKTNNVLQQELRQRKKSVESLLREKLAPLPPMSRPNKRKCKKDFNNLQLA